MMIPKILFIQALALIFLGLTAIICCLKIHDIKERITNLEIRVTNLEDTIYCQEKR